jgi:hypothetical protein
MAETGHAPNVEKFSRLVSFVVGYGGAYKPSNTAIELAQLQAALASAQSMIDGVTTDVANWKTKANARETEYEGIGTFMTRFGAAFAASGAPANAVADMKGYVRKVAGARKKKLPLDDPTTPEDESKGISVSQRSYTQVLETFDAAIALAQNTPQYTPNEVDLQIASMQAKSAAMRAANDAVIAAATDLSNARISRDQVLYTNPTSIFELAKLVKLYVKSLFGQNSPEFKQISGLEFVKPRRR